MTMPFVYSKPSCCVRLLSTHLRRALLAANDELFVLIEEDYSDPDADATLRVLRRLQEGESAGSRVLASSREISISREHLPLGWAGSTKAPCVLTSSASASAFYIFNMGNRRLLRVDTRLDRESTQLHVMQYCARHNPEPMPSNFFKMSAMGMDADEETPLLVYVFYYPSGKYITQFHRVILNEDKRDVCELETVGTHGVALEHFRNKKLSVVSDGKQKVAISSVHLIDVYDCVLNKLIYRISIPAVHARPSRPISIIFTMLYGEEWILCSEKMMRRFDSGNQIAVRAAANEQTWREVVFPPTYRRDDYANPVSLGSDLFYCRGNGIRMMSEGPASLEPVARSDMCVASTKQPISRIHPFMVNYPVGLFCGVMTADTQHSNRWGTDILYSLRDTAVPGGHYRVHGFLLSIRHNPLSVIGIISPFFSLLFFSIS